VKRVAVHTYHNIPRQCGAGERGVLMKCSCRYFNPTVEVQPDHIICGEFPHLHFVRASVLADLAC
jgi:hypothetical protein